MRIGPHSEPFHLIPSPPIPVILFHFWGRSYRRARRSQVRRTVRRSLIGPYKKRAAVVPVVFGPRQPYRRTVYHCQALTGRLCGGLWDTGNPESGPVIMGLLLLSRDLQPDEYHVRDRERSKVGRFLRAARSHCGGC